MSPFQDADAAYVNKVDLGTKVDALTEEINFMRALHEAVRVSQISQSAIAPFPGLQRPEEPKSWSVLQLLPIPLLHLGPGRTNSKTFGTENEFV